MSAMKRMTGKYLPQPARSTNARFSRIEHAVEQRSAQISQLFDEQESHQILKEDRLLERLSSISSAMTALQGSVAAMSMPDVDDHRRSSGKPGSSAPTNDLKTYFDNNAGRIIHKWVHYFDIYERHFSRFRNRPAVILEFGVSYGGSLQMWRSYFGERAMIYGVDINPGCAELDSDEAHVIIGDQEDRNFLRSLVADIGPIDVVIDDGGHTMSQQITTFEEIYPHVKTNGVFLIEDLHTSYWPGYGGGVGQPGTFMEYAKRLTDQLNAWHVHDDPRVQVDEFTRTTASMHFYDSVIVFEKDCVKQPHAEKTGTKTVPTTGGKATVRDVRQPNEGTTAVADVKQPPPEDQVAETVPDRPRRINTLVEQLDYSSYLEIGVERGKTFFAVTGPDRKVAVDPTFRFDHVRRSKTNETESFHQMTSDAYFAGPGADQRFDLVYLDGLHTWGQTLTDLLNSLARTRQDSLILIDDTVPCDPFSAIPDMSRALKARAKYGNRPTSGAWHGDVFRVVLYVHDYMPHLNYATIMSHGNPQTLVWREDRGSIRPLTRQPSEIENIDFYWLDEHMEVLQPDLEEAALHRAITKVQALRDHRADAQSPTAAVSSPLATTLSPGLTGSVPEY